jgi:hypothetical protein
MEYERDISSTKFIAIFPQVSLHLLLGVFAGICQRALVDEKQMIITQMGMHNRSENGHSACNAC